MVYAQRVPWLVCRPSTIARLSCVFVVARSLSLSGEITRVEARVDTRVQELMNGAPASVNADSRELPGDVAEFPLATSAFLDTTNLGGERTAIGQGFGIVEDPARLDEPNPQEFSLEAACYSNAPDVSYLVEGSASEMRTVVLDRTELGLGPFDLRRDVQSRVFLSGAVIFWSATPAGQSDEIGADVAFRVTRDGDDQELFTTSIAIGAGGEALSTGPIVFETVGLDELAALVDETTLVILHQLEEDGELTVIVISQQEHEYEYTATVEEPIVLTATIEVQVRNAPAGTGVAAVMGRPFEELADFIAEALPGTNGAAIERSLNKAISDRDVGLVAPPAAAPPATPRACGALGALAMLIFIPVLLRNRFV